MEDDKIYDDKIYYVKVICNNCCRKKEISLPKGVPVFYEKCHYCGCETLIPDSN